MQFTAKDHPLAVDYKLPGKQYNTGGGEDSSAPNPFETETVQPGQTFDLPEGAEYIRTRELRGTNVDQANDPANQAGQ